MVKKVCRSDNVKYRNAVLVRIEKRSGSRTVISLAQVSIEIERVLRFWRKERLAK